MAQSKDKKIQEVEKHPENEASIHLTLRESLRLLEMIDNPPPRNARFLQAQARYEQKMSIETGSTHITPAGGNVFADLGFEPEEAEALLTESRRIIFEKLAIKDL